MEGIAVMKIGIFDGKKAVYNRLILKLLVENGPLKPWKIASFISKSFIKDSKTSKGYMERTQDVYSNLIRKKSGRLKELERKGYIKRLRQGFFGPTLKGVIAILVSERNLPKISEFYSNILRNIKFPSKVKIPFFDVEVNGKKFERAFKEFADSLSFQEGWQTLKEMVKSFLESGLDLDIISNENLLHLILFKLEINENKIEKWIKENLEA
jgi:hypothetical protein